MVEASGSFDDVAAAADAGGWPFVIAICSDPGACADLATWLESAIPATGPKHMLRCAAAELDDVIDQKTSADNVVIVVEDAAGGDDASLREHWTSWNAGRDRLRVALRALDSGNVVIFLMTRRRMPEIAFCAVDLMAVSHVLTVSEEPFAIEPTDEEGVQVFERARDTLERRYGLKTEEFIRRLFEREALEIPADDVNRWKAVAQALRNVETA